MRGVITGTRASSVAVIAALARRGDIGAPGKATAMIVAGRLRATTTRTGGLDFHVPLGAKAKAALAARGRLALSVRITVASDAGEIARRTFAVTLRAGAAPAKATVVLRDTLFSPSLTEVRRGGTVSWLWRDGTVPHDIFGKGFESKVQSAGTFTFTFSRPGTFTYVCRLHEGMKGKVVVRA